MKVIEHVVYRFQWTMRSPWNSLTLPLARILDNSPLTIAQASRPTIAHPRASACLVGSAPGRVCELPFQSPVEVPSIQDDMMCHPRFKETQGLFMLLCVLNGRFLAKPPNKSAHQHTNHLVVPSSASIILCSFSWMNVDPLPYKVYYTVNLQLISPPDSLAK